MHIAQGRGQLVFVVNKVSTPWPNEDVHEAFNSGFTRGVYCGFDQPNGWCQTRKTQPHTQFNPVGPFGKCCAHPVEVLNRDLHRPRSGHVYSYRKPKTFVSPTLWCQGYFQGVGRAESWFRRGLLPPSSGAGLLGGDFCWQLPRGASRRCLPRACRASTSSFRRDELISRHNDSPPAPQVHTSHTRHTKNRQRVGSRTFAAGNGPRVGRPERCAISTSR